MSGNSKYKGQSSVNSLPGSSKRKAAPGVSGWGTILIVFVTGTLSFGLFGYIFAHTHIALDQYNGEIRFIKNKIETFANKIETNLEAPINSFQQIIPHDLGAMRSEQLMVNITGAIESKTVELFEDLLHLVRIKEQPLPVLITDPVPPEHVAPASNADIKIQDTEKKASDIPESGPIVEPMKISYQIGKTVKSDVSTDKVAEPTINANPESIPKLANATHHILTCPHGDLMTFWKPATKQDLEYVTPFAKYGPSEKYVTFEPDFGGWNNIRMQMELVLVFAAATGRTLVLPPDQPMYLLHHGTGHQKHHSFADFFPFEFIKYRVPVISMNEYMAREAVTGNMKMYPPGNKTSFDGTDRDQRKAMWKYLQSVSSCPPWKSMYEFVVIPIAPGVNSSLLPNASYYKNRLSEFAADRVGYVYDEYWQNQKYLHFISDQDKGLRLLEHFYTFIHFEDEFMDRLYKRFVRDYVHYVDIIWCKAALIVNKLMEESNNSFSTFHIRRGEFQYKEVKISSKELMVNVGHLLPQNQLLYIATDEKNKSFFDDFKPRFPNVRYLDDYMDYADLKSINPNFLGMIDQVVCTKGQYFVGTWFSTFSGYITRMRGYYGFHDYSVYYGDKKRRDRFHQFERPKFPFYMREWNISWYQIDEE